MPKIRLTGFIVVPERDLARLRAELPNHVALTRAERGCLSFDVTESPDDPARYDVAEEFESREAFERHQRRVRSSDWGRITVDVARHYEIVEDTGMPEVRPSQETDLDAILDAHRQAFGDEEGPVIVDLLRELLVDETAKPMVSLVAEVDGRVVGHVLFTAVRVTGNEVSAQILAPIAVLPSHQRSGIGGAMIADGLARLSEAGVELVFVLGHPSYYPRHGFSPVGDRGLETPHPIPPEHSDAWMVQELVPGRLGKVRGTVSCARSLDRPEYW